MLNQAVDIFVLNKSRRWQICREFTYPEVDILFYVQLQDIDLLESLHFVAFNISMHWYIEALKYWGICWIVDILCCLHGGWCTTLIPYRTVPYYSIYWIKSGHFSSRQIMNNFVIILNNIWIVPENSNKKDFYTSQLNQNGIIYLSVCWDLLLIGQILDCFPVEMSPFKEIMSRELCFKTITRE